MVPLVMMEEGETDPMAVMSVALMEGMKALEEEQMLWKPGVKVEGLSFCSLKKKTNNKQPVCRPTMSKRH